MEISDLLLSQTENRPDIQPRMRKLVAEIKYLIENSRSLATYEVLEERAKDTDLLRFVTSTIEAYGELPSLKQRDYPSLYNAYSPLAGQPCGSVPAGLPDFRLHPQLSVGRTAPAE